MLDAPPAAFAADRLAWRVRNSKPTLPEASDAAIRRACAAPVVHVLDPASRAAVRNASFWSGWLRGELGFAREQKCVERLRAFRPAVCRARGELYVAGAAQTLFNRTHLFGTRAAMRRVTALNGSVAHAVLTRNEFGAGFYHVLLDTLASLAFVLDEAPRGAKLLLNPCTTGREHLAAPRRLGLHLTAPPVRATCAPWQPHAAALLDALGLRDRVQPWPYTRQPAGPALAVSRATFDCAHPFERNYQRGFWHVRKLRERLRAAFHLPPPAVTAATGPRLLLVIDRNGCAARSVSEGGCDASRAVAGQAAIVQAMRAAFGAADRVVEFSGREPLSEQASLFARASLVVGPHGAALANTLFCADGTPVVEYHRQHWRKEPNSPLYALLSRQLGLVHWAVVDRERGAREYAGIRPDEVVATAHAALEKAGACESCGVEIG